MRARGLQRIAIAGTTAAFLACLLLSAIAARLQAQASPSEKIFPQSKAVIEQALKNLQGSLAGRLPVLEGFAQAGDHDLNHYQRGYYQTTVQITPAASGGSLVRVSAKVTAWYNDPAASHSGYQLLVSNGRLESDLLDQLAEQLAKNPPESAGKNNPVTTTKPVESASSVAPATPRVAAQPATPDPNLPAAPGSISPNRTFSSPSPNQNLAAQEHASAAVAAQPAAEKATSEIETEVASLEEILKSQAHPKNLVAVKKSGTPVVETPSLTAKPQFMASVHDEFEMLDFNRDWVHVRISGLNRAWIWRNSVEMPEGIPDSVAVAAPALQPAADLFHVIREDVASFPGDWPPLRGKNVKIISVQKLNEAGSDTAAPDAAVKQRLEYAKFLLDKSYSELTAKPQDLSGVVVIFDAADGGMIAATLDTLKQWRAGTLSDSAFWHKCFFDPPETFDSNGAGASP